MIKIGAVGFIGEGDDEGSYVRVKELMDNPSSFLVLISGTRDFSGSGGDYWVEDIASLERFFSESKWVVEWEDD